MESLRLHGHLVPQNARIGRGNDALPNRQQRQRGEHKIGKVAPSLKAIPSCWYLGEREREREKQMTE